MVWANITDNQQVDKPVKPVATISRFAKIKNTQPWYQHFNLVVSPAFSGNHFSGEEVERAIYSENINYFNHHQDERSTSVHARLGGQIKSTSIYARVGYEKTDHSEMRNDRNFYMNDGEYSLLYSDINNYEESGHKVEFTLFGQHQLTHFLHIGYELYHESHDVDGRRRLSTFRDCSTNYNPKPECQGDDIETLRSYSSNPYDWNGEALGGRINLGVRYDYNQTQLTMDYAYSHERYRGRYFGLAAYTKLGHHIELSIYHPWQYGLSTELSLAQVHEDANYPALDRRDGDNISQTVSFEVKKLVSENAALSLNYTRINFSDYRQDYDFEAWFLRLDYQFSNDKPPRRRKRHNNLMRAL
jgi:hypothetical protein